MASDDSTPSVGDNDGAERALTLTRTEGRLWQILRSQPGRIFSRADLMALAMPDAVVGDRTIDVHIFNLRKKLGKMAKGRIEAVRKQGYQWLECKLG